MKNKILIVKNDNFVLISREGKKLIIDSKDTLFNELKNKTKDEIKEWYIKNK